jgi:hypothetical protein
MSKKVSGLIDDVTHGKLVDVLDYYKISFTEWIIECITLTYEQKGLLGEKEKARGKYRKMVEKLRDRLNEAVGNMDYEEYKSLKMELDLVKGISRLDGDINGMTFDSRFDVMAELKRQRGEIDSASLEHRIKRDLLLGE